MANSVKLMTAALRNGMNVEAIWGCPSTASFKIGTILSPQGYDYKFEGHVSDYGVSFDEPIIKAQSESFTGSFSSASYTSTKVNLEVEDPKFGNIKSSLKITSDKKKSSLIIGKCCQTSYLESPRKEAEKLRKYLVEAPKGTWDHEWVVIQKLYYASSYFCATFQGSVGSVEFDTQYDPKSGISKLEAGEFSTFLVKENKAAGLIYAPADDDAENFGYPFIVGFECFCFFNSNVNNFSNIITGFSHSI